MIRGITFRKLVDFCWRTPGIRKKILITLGFLILFRIGCDIPLPGISADAGGGFSLSSLLGGGGGNSSFLSLIGMVGGNGYRHFSIFAIGVSPYVISTVVVQLLSSDIIPSWTKLQKSGEAGRIQLDLIARYLTIPIAIAQSIAIIATLQSQGSILIQNTIIAYIYIIIMLVFGSLATIWVADQISEKGITNGISMIIFSGIAASLPWSILSMVLSPFNNGVTGASIISGIITIIFVLTLFVMVVFVVAYILLAQRKIPVQQTGQGLQRGKQHWSYIPFRLNSAGVIPVIFASAMLTIPLTLNKLINNETAQNVITMIFSNQHLIGLALYFLLVFGFTYFYSTITIKPSDLSDNLRRSNSFIPGVAIGNPTTKYIEQVLRRQNFLGGLSLAIIASLPYFLVIANIQNLNMAIGGTGIIIVVGVAINAIDQLKAKLIQEHYVKLKSHTLAHW